MTVKRSGGRIFGANLTAAEKTAMNLEINRQIAEHNRNNTLEIDAMVLWCLHEKFGFGKERLKKFYDSFSGCMDSLSQRYEMDESEQVYLCTKLLKDYGIDIEKWYLKNKK
jgi:hypothetical protein